MRRLPVRAERRTGRLAVDGLQADAPRLDRALAGPADLHGAAAGRDPHGRLAPAAGPACWPHCLARGARHAEPGEFTLRAFLSGRIDLTRAEAVLGVIDAQVPGAARRRPASSSPAASPGRSWRSATACSTSWPTWRPTSTSPRSPTSTRWAARPWPRTWPRSAAEVAALADRLRGRDRPEGHPRVVLVGPPNAGKSRLFNALLGQPAALVSPRAGTTRDYLSALCDCDGLTVELIDTAGIEPGIGPIEGRAQALRAEQAARADLLLVCRVGRHRPRRLRSAPGPASPPRLDQVRPRPPGPRRRRPADQRRDRRGPRRASRRHRRRVAVRERPTATPPPGPGPAAARASPARASALQAASETLLVGGGDELVAIDLRQAVDELGKVVGAVVTDDILDRIFRRFCIGK